MIKTLVSKVYNDTETNKVEIIKFQAFIVCISAAICITLDEYFSKREFMFDFLHHVGLHQLADSYADIIKDRLFDLSIWVGNIVVFYGIIPLLIIKFVFKDNFSNYGIGIKALLKIIKSICSSLVS